MMARQEPLCLGKGQEIESEMAKEVGIKVFRFDALRVRTRSGDLAPVPIQAKHINELCRRIRRWYENEAILSKAGL